MKLRDIRRVRLGQGLLHRWEFVSAGSTLDLDFKPAVRMFLLTFHCTRCGKVRFDEHPFV